MRYKKITPKNNNWTKTCQALKELFETLRCSKCKSSLHDSQQFLQCGHFSCFSCTKNSNKCIECQFSVNDDILKDDTIKKIIQACCTIAEQVDFKEFANNVATTSKANPSKEQTNPLHFGLNNLDSHSNNINEDSNQSKEKAGNVLKKRKGAKKLTEIVAKKAKLDKIIPTIRIPKNVEKKNHHGETKLQEECKKGRIDNVKVLLDAGADPNTYCAAGWTPLQECADFGFIDIAKLLLQKGADINKKGYQGRTPLHEATLADKLPMVKFLLEHNAQKEIEDNDHNKPIEYCKSDKIKKLLMCNLENGSPRTSKRSRNNDVPQNKIRDNTLGVSNNVPRKKHNVSAINDKIERECDSSNSESDDDGVPDEERHSQNITICHQELAYKRSKKIDVGPFDSEEIDVLN